MAKQALQEKAEDARIGSPLVHAHAKCVSVLHEHSASAYIYGKIGEIEVELPWKDASGYEHPTELGLNDL